MQIRSDGMCKLEWNLKFLPKALWIYIRGISFHSWKFSLYSLCIQDHLNAENLCVTSTFFNPPSLKLLHNVSCFIFVRIFPHRKVFCICSSSSRKEFGINVSNANYTILEIASDLKIVIFPSNDKCLMRQSFIALEIFLLCHKNFYRLEAFCYMRYALLIF